MTKSPHNQPLAQVMEYWQTMRQHGWGIFFLTLGLTLASFVGIALLPDHYRSTTTILVDPQKVPDEYVTSTIKEPLTERLQTISQEVLSSTGLRQIIDKRQLYPELRESMSSEEIVEYMRDKIQIEVKNAAGSGPASFSITYEGRHPVVVAEVTSELATRFIDWNGQNRTQQAIRTTEFLSNELQEAKRSLEEQEKKVRDFKISHLGEMPEDLPATLATLAQLRATQQVNNDALNRLMQERIELTRLSAVESGEDRAAVPLTERGQLEAEKKKLEAQLLELRRHYTASYPEVVEASARLERVKQELKALPPPSAATNTSEPSASAVRLEINANRTRQLTDEQKRLVAQIAAYQAKVDAVPVRAQQITELTRDYNISNGEYQKLLQKELSAVTAANLERRQESERFIVIDPARTPVRPFQPKRLRLMAAAFFISLVVSFGLVVLKEQMDTTVKTESQLADLVPQSVAILASIPRIQTRYDVRRHRWFAILAFTTALVACLAVGAFLWKVHPIL